MCVCVCVCVCACACVCPRPQSVAYSFQAGLVLRKTWRELKVLQSIFVPNFVSRFLSLIMVKQPDIREIGVEMYWAVLWREIEESGEFKVLFPETLLGGFFVAR